MKNLSQNLFQHARWWAAPLAVAVLLGGCSPAEKKMAPADKLADVWKQFHYGEFDIALREIKEVEDSQPVGSDFHTQAVYAEASIWNDRRDARDPDKATSLYKQILKDAPNSPLAPWCALDLIRVQHLAPAENPLDWHNLAQQYGDVYKKYPDTHAGEEAFMYHTNLLVSIAPKKDLPSVLKEMQDFLLAHPKTVYATSLYGYMAACYDRLGQENERLDYMIKALGDTSAPQTGIGPAANYAANYWGIAYAAEFEVGNFTVAREYYQRLLKEYPTDPRAFAAQKALVRMDNVEAAVHAGKPLPPELTGGVAQ